MNANQRRHLHRIPSVALLLAMCLTLSPAAIAQQDAPNDNAANATNPANARNDAAESARQTRIYPLTRGDARSMAAVISELVQPDARIVADPQSNALIVVANAETQQRIDGLIEKLSAAARGRPATTRVFPLQHTRVDGTLRDSLMMALPKEAQLNVDAERNMVVVYGDESAHEQVGQLLAALDRPTANGNDAAAANRAPAYRVRITWLIDIGPLADKVDPAARRPLPDELKPVADELAKLGVKNLYVAARTMVRCTGGEEFAMLSRAKLIEPADLAIEGQFIPAPGIPGSAPGTPGVDPARPRLRIRLSGQQVKLVGTHSTRDGPKQATYGPQEIVNIQTTLTTPLDKPIVLGVSPMEDVTSAFVVTVEME